MYYCSVSTNMVSLYCILINVVYQWARSYQRVDHFPPTTPFRENQNANSYLRSTIILTSTAIQSSNKLSRRITAKIHYIPRIKPSVKFSE
jgi:hypothetical protein